MSQVELHYLTCHRDFEDFLLSVRTFFYWNPVKWKLVVHSDGSLTKDEMNYIRDNFDSRVIDREEADVKVLDFLKEYPYCYDWRKNFKKKANYVMFQKIFDPMVFCEDYYVLFDSDVFFYDKDEFIIKYAKNKTPFYHGGGWGFLTYPVSYKNMLTIGFKPVGNLNGGLIGFKKDMFQIKLIEKYFKLIEENPGKIDNKIGFCFNLEESLFSCLMGMNKETKVIWCGNFDEKTPEYAKTKSGKVYGICSNLTWFSPNNSICIHYADTTKFAINFGRKMAKSKMKQGEGK